ncbi:phytoene/squalene synthase family protein [Ruicaihuangia caeni]|uniref:Phytoene/squalene synthase family protein n=1 Tax=Ruicaihuangia caeni TaxID=3042517 RepID=A0AAW6T939_9MICO|nr:phytoene/squalene synthase family protein [Klugiella sp. YN-L-19]MDI2098863.1 phytoene/squalene synthase family protein [Klugiella sp. YN-L-19]
MIDSMTLDRYETCASHVARVVLSDYSTSFGMATRLLAPRYRPHIANIYGLVRIADEIVDGPAECAGLVAGERLELLDALENEVYDSIRRGFSTNLVVHAFACTAVHAGIGSDLIAPFFSSMRADLDLTRLDETAFREYVYGSAEVVGLMCLRVFLQDARPDAAERAVLVDGARRLGAAFQKINFLRDLGDDARGLGRSYFPNVDSGRLGESEKREITQSIRADLEAAEASIRLLPAGARRAVATAHGLFSELEKRIERTPAEAIIDRRIRVPDAVKLIIALRASLRWSA